MATIYIDNEPYEVADGQNLLTACLSLGFDIPYFCWHPALESVGACRMCAVKQFRDEEDSRGRIVMSCITPATDGTRISINDPEVKEFRAHVIQFLMLNHPHDCPVCEEGGECHLQDMTVMTGQVFRTTRFKKRTHRNQYLGPFLNHEMNRCIQCYRCVRFYRDYAGGRDFNVFGIHNRLYFGRFQEGILENEFSGNLAEVCPTGVFTDKTQREHSARSWDLQTAPSICVHCSVGCNIIPGERYGTLRRIRNRYHSEVNRYFLCDRGRFGYGFVNSDQRVREPLVGPRGRQGTNEAKAESKESILRHIATVLGNASGVVGIGSPRASVESNFALRTLVGPDRFSSGMSDPDERLVTSILHVMRHGICRSATLSELGTADGALVLGEDLTNTAPLKALALRQSIRQKHFQHVDQLHVPRWNDLAVRMVSEDVENGPLYVATPACTKLDDVCRGTFRGTPDDLARLGFAVAHALSPEAPAPENTCEEISSLSERIAEALSRAKRPVVVSGTSCSYEPLVHAAANVAWALKRNGADSRLSYVVPECNSIGQGLWGSPLSLSEALDEVRTGKADTVLIVENDLYRRADEEAVKSALDTAENVIVVDHLFTRCATEADAVLPAGTFADCSGTLINSEGRAQRFFGVMDPSGEIQESWKWIRDIMRVMARTEAKDWHALDDIIGAVADSMPVFERIRDAAPLSDFRAAGMKIPRQSLRYSGRTGMRANVNVHEPKPPDDDDSALAFSMEGFRGQPPAALLCRYRAPGWNSVQAVNKYQREIGGPLKSGDSGARLIEPDESNEAEYFGEIPLPFTPRDNAWLIVALPHIFGSEELSALSPAIKERSPRPFLGLNPKDAEHLGVAPGKDVEVVVADKVYQLEILPVHGLPRGVAGFPAGISGVRYVALPAWGTVNPK